MPKVSIVVPTFNHCEDLLKPCLASIAEYTNLDQCEVIVVANGCTDETEPYLKALPIPFKQLVHKEPIGYTAATNRGIEVATGEFVLLLNNDTVILPQARNRWVELLLAPFTDPKVGATGPLKFTWDCGGIERTALAFWCVMLRRSLFQKYGLLDETFSPGMGEDGDFCCKIEDAGYRLVQVPVDQTHEFGKPGKVDRSFPIYHRGSGTFGEGDYSKIAERNAAILRDRYGAKKSADRLDDIYKICLAHECDTNALFPTLRKYAEKCRHITEFGVRGVFTTWAFLAARPKRLVSYDIEHTGNIGEAKEESAKAGISFEFRQESTLDAVIEPTEMLFIDTKHTYSQLKAELNRHAGAVGKYILIHDTESYGKVGEDGGPGESQAIEEFMAANPEWAVVERLAISNGLTVLGRLQVETSIVIPTCGHKPEEAIFKCWDALRAVTSTTGKEVIVVANGCPLHVLHHLRQTHAHIIEFPDPVGYIRAVNAGIKEARGEFVVLLDDDSILQPHEVDGWLKILSNPFSDPSVAAAGPFAQTYPELGTVLHSGCTMYRKSALEAVGGFDEAFNPGYLGDEDLSIRLRKAGYKLAEVPEGQHKEYVNGTFRIAFPVVHSGTVNTMDKAGADLPLVAKNRKLLYERHTENPGILGPIGKFEKKVSVIIPTCGARLDDLLKPNIESILQHTNMGDVEVIVVANGCTDGTEDYVESLGPAFRCVSFPGALGYTRATNEGIKVAKGEYLIFLNNDVEMLPQRKHEWIDMLINPFSANSGVGITGPLQLHDDYADEDVIIGFCLCIPRKTLDAAGGLLDEAFSPGGGEDIDLCCKVRRLGYRVIQVPKEGKLGYSHTNTGSFMVWHKNNQTFKDIPEYTQSIVKKNGLVNAKRYNRNIRLNLGSGGIEYPGFLSVDLHDSRASIIMDATKLDFPDNSVAEIMALHLFEHLNPYKALDVLREWRRVLKPGGKLVMEMPDIEQLCKRFVTANTGQRYGILNAVYGSVNTTDKGGPDQITSPHLFGWWPQSIADHLVNAGFTNVVFGPEQHPHPESNMHVEATKL